MARQTAQRHKRSFRNYLLNRRLQLTYALSTTLVSAAIAALLGLVIYGQSIFASEQILAGLDSVGMEWINPLVKAQIRTELGDSDLNLVATMVGFGIVLAVGLMLSLIVMTHKVAGPIWRMSQCFEAIIAGRLPVVGALRKGDQLKDLFAVLSTTMESLRARSQRDLEIADALLDSCAQAPGTRSGALTKALAELRESQQQKRESQQ